MYPIKLNPVLKEIVWGGNRLKDDYGFQADLQNIAEAWVLTAREDGDNTVQNGEYQGISFTDLIENNKALLGTKGADYERFPLLIKFIDAKQDLSVQVHPDDDYAKKYENSYGKTEAWYILDCDEGAELIYGFKEQISKEKFEEAVLNNTFLEYVNKVTVHKGDVFFIESGTLHAIGHGILLAEVQQNCNTTYRVYDYGRTVNGKPRELHVKKALDVTNTVPPTATQEHKPAKIIDGASLTELCSCRFFTMTSMNLNGSTKLSVSADSFLSVLVLDGNGSVTVDGNTESIKKGDSVFIPANAGEVHFYGKFEALLSTL